MLYENARDQSKLATWHVWCGTNIGHVWCGTNACNFLVRNKYRTFFGAEQMPDIFFVREKIRPFLGPRLDFVISSASPAPVPARRNQQNSRGSDEYFDTSARSSYFIRPLFYSVPIFFDQYFFRPLNFWCGTNAGHFLVRNKCRTFFCAEQMPDIFWCGTNTGHFLVRSKRRTFFGAEQTPDIFWCGIPDIYTCGFVD